MKLNDVDKAILKFLCEEQLAREASVCCYVECNMVHPPEYPVICERLNRLVSGGLAQVVNVEGWSAHLKAIKAYEKHVEAEARITDEAAAKFVIDSARFEGLYGITPAGLLRYWRRKAW